MAQQMITLEEAASRLGLTPEEMKKRLKTDPDFKRLSQIRDGSTVRFKQSAIEELARELGLSSEADLPLAPLSAPDDPGSEDFMVPGAGEKKKPKKPADDDVLDFGSEADDDVFSLADDSKSASPKSSAKLTPSKPPKNTSDSSADSDVRLDTGKAKKQKGGGEEGVPTEEIALDFSGPGSAVIKGGSSAKLSAPKTGGSSGKLSLPEMNLGKGGPKSSAALNLDLDKGKGDAKKSSAGKAADPKKSDANRSKPDAKKSDANRSKPDAKKKSDLIRGDGPPADSSEFELSLDADSDDFELQMSDSGGDEVDLGSLPKGPGSVARGSKSGINLRDPADSGISLEKKSDKDDAKGSKASKGSKGSKGSMGSMSDSSDTSSAEPSSDVDFELSLDSSAAASTSKLGAPKSGKLVLDSESDSEFELTLDDSSSSSLEQAALGADQLEEGGDKGDIFETDFEIPPMPDESGSEAVAVDSDSDLEKSDFELASDETDALVEDAGDVAVEEEAEAKPKPKARPKKVVSEAEVDLDSEDVAAEEDEDSAAGALKGAKGKRRNEDDEDEDAPAGAMVERPTKPWGVLPALMLAPTFLLVMLGALMGYEMLQTMWGYQQPRKPTAPLIRGLAQNLDMELKDQ